MTENKSKIIKSISQPSFRQIATGQSVTDDMTYEEALRYFEWANPNPVLGVRYSPRNGWQPQVDCKGGH